MQVVHHAFAILLYMSFTGQAVSSPGRAPCAANFLRRSVAMIRTHLSRRPMIFPSAVNISICSARDSPSDMRSLERHKLHPGTGFLSVGRRCSDWQAYLRCIVNLVPGVDDDQLICVHHPRKCEHNAYLKEATLSAHYIPLSVKISLIFIKYKPST